MGIEVQNVIKSFGNPPTDVIKGVSFSIKEGEFVSLLGKSGSGKSTLLYIISSLDTPTKGSIIIDGNDTGKISSKELHAFRNEKMGFVFQFHYLLPEFSALENVLMPTVKNAKRDEYYDRAVQLLEKFDLKEKMNHLPSQLSGGQMQRVAIARALIMNPKYLFADEPTGSLDSGNAKNVMDIFQTINSERNTTLLLVTHDRDFAASAHRHIELVDGVVRK